MGLAGRKGGPWVANMLREPTTATKRTTLYLEMALSLPSPPPHGGWAKRQRRRAARRHLVAETNNGHQT
eukprot:3094426-Pyramimonas_sp.AAC.1